MVLSGMNLNLVAITALTTVLLTALILCAISAIFAFNKAPEVASESLKEFFDGGNSLKIITVFAVLITAAYLGLADQLSEAAIALLSSVAGYVLGSLKNEK